MIYFDKKANSIWYDFIISNYEKISVHAGECRYNFRCHQNSIHEAIRNNDKKIAVVFCIDRDNEPILHYINYSNKKFIDNTLGEWSRFNDYYFVRWINNDQFNYDGLDIFNKIRKEFTEKIPFVYRFLVKITV